MANANPYATSRTDDALAQPEYSQLDSAYAAPDITEDGPFIDTLGWAPSLRLSAQETPDNARLGQRPLQEFAPDPGNPERFYGQRDAEKAKRHSVVDIDANGWEEGRGIAPSDRRFVDNPRRTPPPDIRVTQKLSPRSYSYTRPFMQGNAKMGARDLNQTHFSMADHRRNYPAGDMGAVRTMRNTYRIDPTPWDANMTDAPPVMEPYAPQGGIQSVEVSYGSRNWRLG